jgi:uncharacterized protein (TIGR00369 family)
MRRQWCILAAIMELKVVRKQENSRMCFVCGLENASGLRGSFYELEDGSLLGRFEPKPEWQGYPERLHGGLASAMLDEVMSRAAMVGAEGETWGVTSGLSLNFKKPVPLDGEILARARIVKEGGRVYEASAEILSADGTAAVEATGRFLKMRLTSIVAGDTADLDWRVVPSGSDPETVTIPG